ncbi:hypothetical protein HBHAL_1296 [Halobacillus halophilus DSM 2266]|uniref:Uncharacterized protein n=1 Tax=Halobacillus halophilus (strain ATCC 35676 / DSM 2266 / JCM 20832 / KCTC 3685 / LMG 17431 / NBRC 102448 / NCIMB 2269) TaxID=866895 RepID=I0JHQ4_HALH3|nr:hypothetical protein HBHAL_1296 [Halobacillus halophilus DSM 2266]
MVICFSFIPIPIILIITEFSEMDGFEFEIENERTRYFLWIIVIASVEQ